MRFNCAGACGVQQRSRLPTRFSRHLLSHRPQRDAFSTLSSVSGNLDAAPRAWEEQQDRPEPTTAGTPPDHLTVRPVPISYCSCLYHCSRYMAGISRVIWLATAPPRRFHHTHNKVRDESMYQWQAWDRTERWEVSRPTDQHSTSLYAWVPVIPGETHVQT